MEVPAASVAVDVPCELVEIEQAGGYRGWARLYEPARPARAAAVYLHGIQSHSGWFTASCHALREDGVTVLAPDRRGSGLNRVDRAHVQSPQELMDDLDRCVDWLRARTGRERVDLVGVSWSGKLAVVYAHQYARKIGSVALVAPGLRARIDIGLREKIAIGAEGLIRPRQLHEIPLQDPHLFTETPRWLRYIEKDPLKLTHATASFFVTSRRLDVTLGRIIGGFPGKIRLFLAESDRIINNSATLRLLEPALAPLPGWSSPARVYPGAQHTLDFEPDPTEFFAELAAALG